MLNPHRLLGHRKPEEAARLKLTGWKPVVLTL
jgi:hypothetical protein